MGNCCCSSNDATDPARQVLPPKRIGAIFSDIDGTLVHYQAKLEKQGYERISESPGDTTTADATTDDNEESRREKQRAEHDAGKIVQFRHPSAPDRIISCVPVPSSTLRDGFISIETVRLVKELKEKHDVNFVVMTGARSATFVARCNRDGALPLFDVGVCEGGGRIYANKNSKSSSSSSSSNKVSENAEEGLVLDEAWLDKFSDAIGPWRDNEKQIDPAGGRSGPLWDCFRHLQDKKKLLDSDIEIVPKLDAYSFVSSFLVSLAKTAEEQRRYLQQQNSPTRNPLSASSAAASSSPTTATKPTPLAAVLGQTAVSDDEINLQLLIKQHFPQLTVHTNLSAAQISSKGCTKADVVEYLSETHFGVHVGEEPARRAAATERKAVQKIYFQRKAEFELHEKNLDALIDECEEKRMKSATLQRDVEEIDAANEVDDKKIREAKQKYRTQLETESRVHVVAAAKKIDAGREQLRELRHFWVNIDEDENNSNKSEKAAHDLPESDEDGDVDQGELPLPLIEVVEAVSLILRCKDEDVDGLTKQDSSSSSCGSESDNEQQQKTQYGANADGNFHGVSESSNENKEKTTSNNKNNNKKKSSEHRQWRGTLGCFMALVKAATLVDELVAFSPFDVSDQMRDRVIRAVDNAAVFVGDDPAEVERQERLKLLKMSTDSDADGDDDNANSNKNKKQQDKNRKKFEKSLVAPLVEWCRAVARFFDARNKLKPRFDKIREKQQEVNNRRKQALKKRDEIEQLRTRVAELESLIADGRRESKSLSLRVAEYQLRLSALEDLILHLNKRQQDSAVRNEQLAKLRAGRKKSEQPRCAAALFDDENDIGFARLCDVGFTPSVAHPAVADFLDSNSSTMQRCPVEGFLGVEYALQRIADLVIKSEGDFKAWEVAQGRCCAGACCC